MLAAVGVPIEHCHNKNYYCIYIYAHEQCFESCPLSLLSGRGKGFHIAGAVTQS